MSTKKIFALLMAFAMVLSLVACGFAETTEPTAGSTAPSTVETMPPLVTAPLEEPTVSLSKIVVYNSSLCTVLEAFGKADTIVGAYGTLAETYGVPSCGKWNEVDVESVIATGAEAVFGYAKYTTEEQISKLSQAGIACYFIELSDADAAADEIRQLGELFGCQKKAKVFTDLYERYDAMLTERLAGVEDLLTVYVEGTAKEPFKTANRTTAAHKLVTGAGLTNVYAENETAYPERNLEAIIVADPDVIVKLCSASVDPSQAYDEYVSGLYGVGAADADRVILLNNEVGTTAIGCVIGRLYIAKFAYPDLFADVDVDEIYEELCTDFLGKEFSGSGAFMK